MADFPIEKTNAVDNVTEILAKHLNNLEDKVGIDNDTNVRSLDYIIKKRIGEWTKKVFTADGNTTNFTLDYTPIDGSVMLFYEGVLQIGGDDFTLSGKVITTTFTPEDGTKLVAWHRKIITL